MSRIRNVFPTLSHWGAFDAHVENGRLIHVTPFSEDPHPSRLIETWPEMIYSENRITRPAIRRGWLDTVARGRLHPGVGRGSDAFVNVPWHEALDLVASELERVRTNYGNASIFGGSYGWSSAGRMHHARTLIHRFMGAIGGCTGQVTNYSYGAAMRLLPHIFGDDRTVAGPVTDWNAVLEHCDEFVAFGGIAAKNWQIQSGGAGLHPFDDFMAEASSRGIRFTNVSPLRDDVSPILNPEWLQIRPGTDMAFILGLAHVVHASGESDMEFINRYCVGFERFEQYLTGKTDGIAKTPEWAAPITGIPVGTIVAFARKLIGRRVLLSASWSLQRAQHGEQCYWGLATLAAMLGQIGLPGAGVAYGYGSMNGMGNPLYQMPISGMPAIKQQNDLKIPVARIADMLLSPGETVEFDGSRITYPDIKLVYWAGGNPFHHHQDLFRLQKAFQRPETVIVHEPWWTATARHADIVLPATTTLERNDIGGSSRDPYLFAMHKAIEPVGEARDDYRIFCDLADRLGAGEDFHMSRNEEDWLRDIYGRFSERMSKRGFISPDFETFWKAGYVRIPDPEGSFTLFSDFRNDLDGNPLATPSGKIELFSETVAAFGYDECPGHAVWCEPSEWLGADLVSRFPLHLISNQPAEKLHGQMDASSLSRSNKIGGRTGIHISSPDAQARGLKDGDMVRVFNERGACLAGVWISDGIMPGVVCLPTGATFEPITDAGGRPLENHGNPNVLTKDVGTSRLGQGSSAQTCLVEIERYNDVIEPVRVLGQPRFQEV